MTSPSHRDLIPRLAACFTFGGLLLVCALNYWIFRELFGLSYILWYSNAGPFIALATAAFGAAWGGIDKNPALISANPLNYVGACFQVIGLPMTVFGEHLQSRYHKRSIGFEALAALPLIVALVVAMFAWLVFIVPPQYFVFLICGAPSRIALSSSATGYARIAGNQLKYEVRRQQGTSSKEEGSWDASMRDKPVTLASAFSAALLFFISFLWRYWPTA
jgi:hypothetical protein